MEQTRREFLWTGTSGISAAWIAAMLPAITTAACEARDADGFELLTEDEARELEAVAARIVPGTTEDPGAREAGVVRFMDRAFGGFLAGSFAAVREGLPELRMAVDERYPGEGPFSRLDAERQDTILRSVESEPYFAIVRTATVLGMFAMPAYGGNRDGAGWRAIGYEPRGGWQPPFGHYDAEASDV